MLVMQPPPLRLTMALNGVEIGTLTVEPDTPPREVRRIAVKVADAMCDAFKGRGR